MKLNIKNFKKVDADEHFTTMRNDAGHEIRIAHKGLHPATRGQLAALPLAEGGKVSKDPTQQHLLPGDALPNKTEKAVVSKAKSRMADGGEVADEDISMSDDPQSEMASRGLMSAAKHPAIAKALDVTGNLKSHQDMVNAARSGDPAAQQALAEHSNGIAMGSLKTPSRGILPEARSAIGAAAAPPALYSNLEQAQALSRQVEAAGLGQAAQAAATQSVGRELAKPVQGFRPKRMAEGGDVSTEEQPLSINTQSPQIPESLAAPTTAPGSFITEMTPTQQAFTAPGELPYGVTPEAATATPQTLQPTPLAPSAPTASQQSVVATPPQADVMPDITKTMTGSLGKLQHGLQAEAAAVKAQGDAQALALQENQAIQQAAQADYQSHYAALDNERAALMKDIQAQHIDPSHYMTEMSTSSKIATAIGLIASGMGAGMAHQENLASKFLTQQIDNDIAAQKANLGKTENLLSANLRQFGNMKDATDMTRLMRADMLTNQLQTEAAKAQGPLAKARLEQEAAKIQLQYAPLQQKIAMNKTIGNMTAAAQADPSKAQALIQAISQVDPAKAKDLQERLIPGMGFANTPKDAQHLIEVNASSSNTLKGINELLELSSKPGAKLSMEDRAKAHTISTLLVGSLNKQVTGGGPMSAQEQELVHSLAADPTKLFSLDSTNKAKLKTLAQRTNEWVASEASARGIGVPDPVSKLPPQQQAFVKWARANPTTLKAKMILEKLGLE